MDVVNKEQSGWDVALAWLSGLEETARDFHGTLPKAFCERAYEHSTASWHQLLEEQYGITIPKAKQIKEAIENHIEVGIRVGLFKDASQFELNQVNPQRVEIKTMDCIYRPICEKLLENGSAIRDLTCARVGCFKASAELLAGIPCKYDISGFNNDGTCEGYVEHR